MLQFRFSIGLFSLSILVSGCLTGGEKYISKREPMPVVATQKVPSTEGPKIDDARPRDLFVRQKEIKIRRKAPVNDTGSLTDLNDPRAYLLGFERPIEVGSYVDVKMASNRVDTKSSSKEAGEDPAVADGKVAEAGGGGTDDAKNILKSLPNLEPLDGKAALMTSMKMEIMEKFENGDVLVMHRRRSMREGQASEIVVTSRLPSTALSRQDQLSTKDLVDVDWRESFDGEVAERKSANWEDEYTLRLSGFEESKSKQAMAVDEKRQELKTARDKFEKDLKQQIAERDKISKERASLMDEKEKASQKVSELTTENEELKKKLGESSEESSDAKDDKKDADKKSTDKKSAEKPKDQKSEAKKPEAKKAETKK